MSTPSNPSEEYPGGYIRYAFDMHVDYDQEISCGVPHPKVQGIVLKKELITDRTDSKWSLTISFGSNSGISEVDQIGNSIKDNVFELLCLVLDRQVKNVRLIGHGLTPRPGEGGIGHLIMPSVTMSATGSGTGLPLNSQGIQEIQDTINRYSIVQYPLLGIFRHAINVEDHVLQFILLYLILYEICKNQAGADKFILKVEPSTPQSTSPFIKGIKETVYTKLRNQLTHRASVDPEETRSEIANNLDQFRRIVRKALQASLRNP